MLRWSNSTNMGCVWSYKWFIRRDSRAVAVRSRDCTGRPRALCQQHCMVSENTTRRHRTYSNVSYSRLTASRLRSWNVAPSASFDSTCRLWNAATGECLKIFLDHTRPVYALTFSPDGRWLGTGSGDGWLHIYSVKVRYFYRIIVPSSIFIVFADKEKEVVVVCR